MLVLNVVDLDVSCVDDAVCCCLCCAVGRCFIALGLFDDYLFVVFVLIDLLFKL